MGWFDEQIKLRKQSDDDAFADSFVKMAGAVMGEKVLASLNDDRIVAKNEIDEILKFYHVKSREVPDSIEDMNEQLEYLMRPYGIMRRTVCLEKGWYKDAIGAMLGVMKETGKIVALLPGKVSGYSYYDIEAGKRRKITHGNEDLFEKEALAFYKPFPMKKMGIPSLAKYIMETLSGADYGMMLLAALAVTFVGMLTPKINQLIFSEVLPSGSMQLFFAISVFMVCTAISSLLFEAVSAMVTARVETKLSLSVEAATMMRVMSLPAVFFRKYSAGELSSRASQINSLCNMLVSTVFTTGITSVFSLIYISQIFAFAPALVAPALTIVAVTVAFSVISSLVQMGISRRQMELAGKENGMTYAMITGVQKIKLSGAEKRAFARWGDLYAKEAKLKYNPPVFIKINAVISTGISLAGTIVMYYAAIRSGVSVADYYAFNTAYGMVSGAFLSLAGIALTVARIRPTLEMVKPLFETVPEVSSGKQVITGISGGIELNHISFRYNENMPLVLDDLSLKIHPGQYVAIVGQTGCGKSTLKSLRQKIGVVIQNGKLFQGDIYSNIVISAPWLTQKDAWEAAELAGIAEDIRKMPMGMNTMISEGSGGISGGQKQRLMIARAIAQKPRLLMLDEATSALDNLTQKKVSEALDGLKCTRIVIAHRLSTIKQCDRILVLDKGKIIEDGKYEELLEKNGFFAELVKRQRLDAL